MLGIILIYFIGKKFYDLALANNKNGWLFGILAVIIYYASIFLGGIIIGIIYAFVYRKEIPESQTMALGLIAIPFGLLVTWGFYTILKRNWAPEAKPYEGTLLDADIKDEK